MNRRQKIRLIIIVVVGLLVGAWITWLVSTGEEREPIPKAVQDAAESQLKDGYYTGKPPWPPEYAFLDGRVAKMNLPEGGSGEAYHVHVLLSVFIEGKQVEVPTNIGIPPGGGHVPLHTHTGDGLIHVEAPKKHPYTIDDIFNVWGVRFTEGAIGEYEATADKPFNIYVNGKRVEKDPTQYVFKQNDNIVVGYGPTDSFPHEPDTLALEGA
jgi:hypothetical protein